MKRLFFVLVTLAIFSNSVIADEIGRPNLKLPGSQDLKQPLVNTRIEVKAPFDGEICKINYPCSIIWVTNLIKNHNMVWLQIVWPDGTPTAGSYPVPNNGQYNWSPDSSFWDASVRCKEYRVKVSTVDNKYKGMSGRFKVGKELGHCP